MVTSSIIKSYTLKLILKFKRIVRTIFVRNSENSYIISFPTLFREALLLLLKLFNVEKSKVAKLKSPKN